MGRRFTSTHGHTLLMRMKSVSKVILMVVVMIATAIFASSAAVTGKNVVNQIVQSTDSTILIELSPSINKEIVPEPRRTTEVKEPVAPKPKVTETANTSTEKNGKKTAIKTNGYRIQIFGDGRDQNTLQKRARERARKILGKFPRYNHQVYSFSKSPNYYTRIGNFATRDEANKALAQLRTAFPEYAGEMRVVSSEVILNK